MSAARVCRDLHGCSGCRSRQRRSRSRTRSRACRQECEQNRCRENVDSTGIPHSSQAGRRSDKIFFLAMTLARSTRPWIGGSGSSRAQPVSPTLRAPLLFAAFGLAIVMSCFPLSPLPCFLPALLAAVARQRVHGAKSSLASFQQTSPTTRTSNSPPLPGYSAMASLIFLATWTIFTRAHGRCLLPEAQAPKGNAILFGAPSV